MKYVVGDTVRVIARAPSYHSFQVGSAIKIVFMDGSDIGIRAEGIYPNGELREAWLRAEWVIPINLNSIKYKKKRTSPNN